MNQKHLKIIDFDEKVRNLGKVCRFHGARGGSKTEEGRLRQKEVNMKNGFYSKEAIEERRAFREFLNEHKAAICGV